MTIYAITLCYNRPDIIFDSLKAYRQMATLDLGINHYLVDNRYPLPSPDAASGELRATAALHGGTLLEPGRNLGLSGGFNFALSIIKPEPHDIVIGYDGDSHPLTRGFDRAMVSALETCPDAAWVSCSLPASLEQLTERGYRELKLPPGLVAWEAKHPVVNSICAFPAWFLGAGIKEPNHYYGGLEMAMWDRLQAMKKKWIFLPEYREDNEIKLRTDPAYVLYKWCYAHEHSWVGDFDSFLAAGCPHKDANGMTKLLYQEFDKGNHFK